MQKDDFETDLKICDFGYSQESQMQSINHEIATILLYMLTGKLLQPDQKRNLNFYVQQIFEFYDKEERILSYYCIEFLVYLLNGQYKSFNDMINSIFLQNPCQNLEEARRKQTDFDAGDDYGYLFNDTANYHQQQIPQQDIERKFIIFHKLNAQKFQKDKEGEDTDDIEKAAKKFKREILKEIKP